MSDIDQRAEEEKNKGNECYKLKKYQEAIDLYTKSLEIKESAPVYCNRALCNIYLENYGAAVQDAEESVKLDPNFTKLHYKNTKKHFATSKNCVQLKPSDKIAQSKVTCTRQELRTAEFYKAIQSEKTKPASETFNWQNIKVEDSYTGKHIESLDDIDFDFVQDMIQRLRDQKKLHRKYAAMIILKTIQTMSQTKTLFHVNVPSDRHITVCGDTHGQYYDLLKIFEVNGSPSESNPYLFNGDFVDRGSFSVEIVLTLFAYKAAHHDCMFLTRGNHESRHLNRAYGFEGEVKAKYDENMYELFQEAFNWLPLAGVLNNKVMVVHGGIPTKDGVTLQEIEKVDRNRDIPEDGIMCDMLWADPQKGNGLAPSKRGVSYQFGPDVTKKFLDQNNLSMVVRSHEVKMDGYEEECEGRLVTIFSAPNYCDSVGNKGAYIHFKGSDMKPIYKQFQASPHPNVKPMQYSNQLYNQLQ
ncbi:serine/threonine-protein phosphatase [Acrasis kona]|uniref:Serine/threonine-protein phosphatase T n=1 Tax=Acrasis kona TaxID=1008807 RepID=A0AAW2ZCE1_9EUKA